MMLQQRKKGVIIAIVVLLCLAFLLVVAPMALAQMTEQQATELIYELEEIAHELEHVEEWLRIMAFTGIGIFLVLLGQLVIQYMGMKKK